MRFFAQHLPEFGWEPVVLTTDPRWYEWPVDPENERLLPPTTKVERTALQNASEVAILLLTTDCIIVEKPKEKDEHAGHGHGGGGMGGMGGGMGGMGGMDDMM